MRVLGLLIWVALLLWWRPWEPAPDCVGWRELVPAQGATR